MLKTLGYSIISLVCLIIAGGCRNNSDENASTVESHHTLGIGLPFLGTLGEQDDSKLVSPPGGGAVFEMKSGGKTVRYIGAPNTPTNINLNSNNNSGNTTNVNSNNSSTSSNTTKVDASSKTVQATTTTTNVTDNSTKTQNNVQNNVSKQNSDNSNSPAVINSPNTSVKDVGNGK